MITPKKILNLKKPFKYIYYYTNLKELKLKKNKNYFIYSNKNFFPVETLGLPAEADLSIPHSFSPFKILK